MKRIILTFLFMVPMFLCVQVLSGQVTTRVSVDSAGMEANGGSYMASISYDGRYAAFESMADNLVPGDTNGFADVFLHDRVLGQTIRVSVDSTGSQANGGSYGAFVSADGNYIVFASDATNLVPGDTNGYSDIFVHDRSVGQTFRVNVDSMGNEANSYSHSGSISSDGRYVTFQSDGDNLVSGDGNGWTDIFVHDRTTASTTRVSVDSVGNEAEDGCYMPFISASGNCVVFQSMAGNLVAGDTNTYSDVFVHEIASGLTTRVSVDSSGNQGTGYSNGVGISADGRYVAFESDASNLVPDDTNGVYDVFVHDRTSGETSRVSVDSAGNQANGDSTSTPGISADGRFVAFMSSAYNLVADDTNGLADVFLHDRVTGITSCVSVDSSGTRADGTSNGPGISGNGCCIVYTSEATNLVPGDTNMEYDIFVGEMSPVMVLPTVTTLAVSGITDSGADCGGDVTENGGDPVTAKGVCWNTAGLPTLMDNSTADGTGMGAFTSILTGLNPSTTYYVRAYAVNSIGTAYGNEEFFTSPGAVGVPVVTTAAVTGITSASAVCGGDVTDPGMSAVTARGVCWSTVANPTVSDFFTDDGIGGGEFVSVLSGLAAGTTYYVRSYAINMEGTAYGNEVVFTTTGGALAATMRVSVDSFGNESSDYNYGAAVSSNGIAFMSHAANLVSGDTNGLSDIFVHNRNTGQTVLVSVDSFGSQATGNCYTPSLSEDGNIVAFESEADNLYAGDSNGVFDIFVHNRSTGQTTCASVDSSGNVGNDGSYMASVSGDGEYVVYVSSSSNLVSGDGNGYSDIFLHHLGSSQTFRVSVDSAGGESNGYSYEPALSHDGRYIVFASDASNLVPNDFNGIMDIFRHDRVTGETIRVSVDSMGSEADYGSNGCSVSADGTIIVFSSDATNLVPGDGNGKSDIFLYEYGSGQVSRVSVDSSGMEANEGSYLPEVSGNGRYVVFGSQASNLVAGDTNGGEDIFMHDRVTGTTIRCSVDSAGNESNGFSHAPSITADGGLVAFESEATNLVADDTNGYMDIFVRAVSVSSVSSPQVVTGAVTVITSTTAECEGEVTDDGGSAVTDRGICWNIGGNPTMSDNTASAGSGTGIFSASLTGLTPAVTYYIKAYAVNGEGTSYGSEIDFTTTTVTVTAPVVVTVGMANIASTTAACEGEVIDDGGDAATSRGMCWNTLGAPTLADNSTDVGPGPGTFIGALAGLTPETVYYVRAFATNSAGTSYGESLAFSTHAGPGGVFRRVSINSTGIEGNMDSFLSGISGDGGIAVIMSNASNLVAADTNGVSDIFIHTLGTGETRRVSVDSTGIEANYPSNDPSISSDGRFVVFASTASNLVAGDTNGVDDIFLHDLNTAETTRVSVDSVGNGGNDTSWGPSISADGRFVAFVSRASNLVSGDTNGMEDIFVYDRVAGLTTRVNVDSSGNQSNANSDEPAISGDGNYVIFSSGADNLVPGDGNGQVDVFLHNRITGETIRVSIDSTGMEGNGISGSGSVSATGDFVAFKSRADNLVPGDTNWREDIFLHSLADGATKRVSVDSSGMEGDGDSYDAQISADGRIVVFESVAANLVAGDTNAVQDVFLHDGSTGWTTRLSEHEPGVEGNSWSSGISIAQDNSMVIFDSESDNFVGNDTNLTSDIFVRSVPSAPLTVPVVTTSNISGITETTAIGGGDVTANGGASVTSRGVCWSEATNPTTADNFSDDGVGIGAFSSSISGLSPGTTYYVRAYAVNSEGSGYGNEVVFTTTSMVLSTVTTEVVSGITLTSATCGGEVTEDGGSPVTSRGVCWSESSNPTTAGNLTNDGAGVGVFSSSISGLNPGTTYYVRAYAISSAGVGYGNDAVFTTTAVVVPTVTTASVSGITLTSAISGGEVTQDGGSPVTSRGVCWSEFTTPTTAGNSSTDGAGSGIFSSSISGLNPGAIYYVRAYAVNSAGTSYGNEVVFTTIAVVVPTVTTASVSGITLTSAAGGGDVIQDGGSPVTSRGVCWSESMYPTIANSFSSDGAGSGAFSSSLSGLNPGTMYYVRAYAVNSAGTGYGNEMVFTTTAVVVPTVTTDAVSGITMTSATCGGEVTQDGGSPVTSRGVCWSESPNPTTVGIYTNDGGGSGVFSSSISGLNPGTTYYVRAYAVNSAGTGYGNEVFFATTAVLAPTVSTAPVTGISTNTATCGGNISDAGGGAIFARGICWSTAPDPTTADPFTNDGTGTGEFVSYFVTLEPGTTYYVRAYASNSAGTSYGDNVSFTTMDFMINTISMVKEKILSDVYVDATITVTSAGTPVQGALVEVIWSGGPYAAGEALTDAQGQVVFRSAPADSPNWSFIVNVENITKDDMLWDVSGSEISQMLSREENGIFDYSVFALNSLYLRSGARVNSGDVGVFAVSPGPWLDGDSEVSLSQNVYMSDGVSILADKIKIKPDSSVDNLYYNTLLNFGTVRGEEHTPLVLPLDVLPPEFPTPQPGTEEVAVAEFETVTLAPGAYGDVVLDLKGVLVLPGGTYHLKNLNLGNYAEVRCEGPVELIINNRLATGKNPIIGPTESAGIGACDIVFYVNGVNGLTGSMDETPKAASIGIRHILNANIYAPNGTIHLKARGQAEGAFIGRDVMVEFFVEITLNSCFY